MTRRLLLVLAVSVSAAFAQTDATVDDHEQAVLRLLELTEARAAYENALRLSQQVVIEQNPMMADLDDVLTEFYAEYAGWGRVEPRMVAIYMDLFTEGEIEDLIAFYESDTGQRFIEQQSELQARSMRVGADVVAENRHVLEAMIEEALSGPPEPGAPKKGSQRRQ